MTVAGVICEYNPFHLGHAKQFRQIRERLGEDAAIICVMSGRYVQRGAPAVFEPAVRASAAIDCGASLVLELPVTYALRSAEGFARGGVEILTALGVTDSWRSAVSRVTVRHFAARQSR
ncbi:MAG: nucleotidyltransferase family protein [Oscillospiraceae bacterium]|nr:nucleotidyltransferase family protein [Oscillospiraceae bacterium]